MKNEFTVEKLLLINKELEDENEILKLSIKDLKYKVDNLTIENDNLKSSFKNRLIRFLRRVKNKFRRR